LYTKYHCISIPDDIVCEWIPLLNDMPTYLFSLHNKHMGIDHYAITLIPPESIKLFLAVVNSYKDGTEIEAIKTLYIPNWENHAHGK